MRRLLLVAVGVVALSGAAKAYDIEGGWSWGCTFDKEPIRNWHYTLGDGER